MPAIRNGPGEGPTVSQRRLGGALRYVGGVRDIVMGLATCGLELPGTLTRVGRQRLSANAKAAATGRGPK